MPLLAYLVGSGLIFFVGLGLFLLGLGAMAAQLRGRGILLRICFLAGAVCVTISSTPLPWFIYAILTAQLLTWYCVEAMPPERSKKVLWNTRGIVTLSCLLLMGFELPFHLYPAIRPQGLAPIFVIGDSLSAGAPGDPKPTWPALMAKRRRIDIENLAQPNATVADAVSQAEKIGPKSGVVLLEIGGEDLASGVAPSEFEEHLDALLAVACQNGRTILMFELPLPPFRNAYGRVQRDLARKYSVSLIPKRVLIGALLAEGKAPGLSSTALSAAGQQRLADSVWQALAPAYSPVQ